MHPKRKTAWRLQTDAWPFFVSCMSMPPSMLPMPGLFALSCCCYGWLARHPTQTLTMKLWATVKAGQGVNRQAHKWLRCLPDGAKNHLDCIAGRNLVRVVMQLLKDGPLRWHKDAGAPVATLRKLMSDHHWTETAHWTWKHERSCCQFE